MLRNIATGGAVWGHLLDGKKITYQNIKFFGGVFYLKRKDLTFIG